MKFFFLIAIVLTSFHAQASEISTLVTAGGILTGCALGVKYLEHSIVAWKLNRKMALVLAPRCTLATHDYQAMGDYMVRTSITDQAKTVELFDKEGKRINFQEALKNIDQKAIPYGVSALASLLIAAASYASF